MPRLKDETLSIRTSTEVKQLLKAAAELERRSVASMMEVLILEYARRHNLHTFSEHEKPIQGDASLKRLA